MLLFVASALAGTAIGWPCQRLNWAWRNVWSTCSINSFAPNVAAETGATQPTHFRFSSVALVPEQLLNNAGVFTPAAGAGPTILCGRAPNTGSGATANLRNRCRRAIDAYGSLVKHCKTAPTITTGGGSPDHNPQTGHQPHVTNVQGLTHNAQFCMLPVAGGQYAPQSLGTPSNTCPGLLGWFTVVFNACSISNSPIITSGSPAGLWSPSTPMFYTPAVYTASNGHVWSPNVFGHGVGMGGGAIPISPANGVQNSVVNFCHSAGTSWNPTGPGFRSSRCRRALDQFGRTAARCHRSFAAATGPAQAGGWADPLRTLAFGAPTANPLIVTGGFADNTPVSPMGIINWGPACNG